MADTQCSAVSPKARPAVVFIRALVVSKVDYCCSVLAGVSRQLLYRLQSLLNAAARLVFSVRGLERITPLLLELHWLRVPERITFHLCVLTYRCLNGSAPAYLADNNHLTETWKDAVIYGYPQQQRLSFRQCRDLH